jgi:periplasmic divalent cation tolerance protein
MGAVLVYITCQDRDEAMRIARTLVEERLAACANVHGAIDSFYWWEGKVQSGAEVALVAKTRSELADALTARVKKLHSYTVPCVVTLDIEGGNPDFLDWIEGETTPQAK